MTANATLMCAEGEYGGTLSPLGNLPIVKREDFPQVTPRGLKATLGSTSQLWESSQTPKAG